MLIDLVLPLAALGRPPERLAILGNAAGTTARAYGHYFPDTVIDGPVRPRCLRVRVAWLSVSRSG